MSHPASASPALWSAAQAVAATGGEARGDWRADGVSIDSRTLAPGDLFVALKGPHHDGHDHVNAALGARAAAAMVEHPPETDSARAPLLIVPDSFAGLYALAKSARARSAARIIAVTGSVGKTGTKEMIARALAPAGSVSVSAGNLNNQFGAPLSLARLPAEAAYGVFELGMHPPGDIAPLSRLARPHVVLVTNVEAVHTEFFDHVDAVAAAKAEIFAGLEPDAVAVLNCDNKYFDYLAARAEDAGAARILSFGRGDSAEARLLDWSPDQEGGLVEAEICGARCRYRLALSGGHWALNSVAALATAVAAGAPLAAAADALAGQQPLPGRGARHRLAVAGGAFELIDESYNASPVAVRAAIASLRHFRPGPAGRRIAVLGDMLELGDSGPQLHAALAPVLERAGINLVFTIGPLMSHLFGALAKHRRAGQADSAAAMLPLLQSEIRSGDVVLVKGSLGVNMRLLVDALTGQEG
jgi:UDP-N-acetylmuramoyl-tripeptide--D-alanyl-D-alanine ligase